MAGVQKKDIPIEAAMMPEVWELIKAFYIPEEDEDYWRQLQNQCEKIYNRYPSRLTFFLLKGVRDFLEEKSMRKGMRTDVEKTL